MYLIVFGINTINNETTAIIKSVTARLYLLVQANIKLARVIKNIKKIMLISCLCFHNRIL